MKKVLALVSVVISIVMVSCQSEKVDENREVYTAKDILFLLGVKPYAIQLPDDLTKDQEVVVEAFSESGIVDSVSLDSGFVAGSILKIFLEEADESYRVASSDNRQYFKPGKHLHLGGARLSMSTSEPISNIGDSLGWFTIDATIHDDPKGDDIVIRVVIKD